MVADREMLMSVSGNTDHDDSSLLRIVPDNGIHGGVQNRTSTPGNAEKIPGEKPLLRSQQRTDIPVGTRRAYFKGFGMFQMIMHTVEKRTQVVSML